jgi:outer membrane biosynthesis protein TonB
VLVAGAAAAWFTVGPGAKRPQTVSLLSAPPGALVELDGRALGATPLQIVDPPAGARLRLTLAGHLPADAAIPPDARELRIDMTPEPPPQPPPQPAPEASAAPPGTPASPTAATPEPAPEPKAPPAAAPEPEKARPKGTKAAKPPKKKPPEPPKKKNFDLFKHLERQAGTH